MPSIETAVLRIINPGGEVVGTGFLVAPSLGVTCAHVVESLQIRPGGSLQLSLGQASLTFTARIMEEGYSPPWEHDLAFLRLEAPPPGSTWLSLGRDDRDSAGRGYISYGYAPVEDILMRWSTGTLGGRVELQGIPLLQLEGAKFAQGMSGAPVLDQANGFVVGMFSMFPRQLKEDFAYATPAGTIDARWPGSEPRPYFSDLFGSLATVVTGFRAGLQDYLDFYLGTPQAPAPFGGRQAQLDELEHWLNSPRPSFGLLVGRAGRGKSALLAHWAQGLVERRLGRVILIPISVRFNIHAPDLVYRALAVRLAELQRRPAALEGLNGAAQWQEACRGLLAQAPPPGLPVVVILDGLDELAAAPAGLRALFPPVLAGGMKLLVAARYLAGDSDEQGWVQRLEWPRKARSFYLPLLKKDGLAEVLDTLAEPLGKVTADLPGLGEQLFRLTGGDPLLLRLYVEELLAQAAEAEGQGGPGLLRPEDLPSISRGLKGFFERWWREQQDLWQEQGQQGALAAQDVLDFLNLLAAAQGPLSAEEVAEVAGGTLASGLRLEQVAAISGRFVIGSGSRESGYVFSHPRLGDFFRERMLRAERRRWQQNFLDFGQRTLAALRDGSLRPQDALPYPVRHFGAHLEEAGAPGGSLYALLCRPWLDAWEAAVGETEGFLLDAQLAWKRAENDPAALGVQARAALIHTSLTSLSSAIPVELLVEAVRKGALGPRQGYLYARRKPDRSERVIGLAGLHPLLPEELQPEALALALEAGRGFMTNWGKMTEGALQALAPLLSPEQAGELVDLALGIKNEVHLAAILCACASRLEAQRAWQIVEHARVWRGAASQASASSPVTLRGPALRIQACTCLAEAADLEQSQRAALCGEALELINQVGSPERRSSLMAGLVPLLAEEQLPAALDLVPQLDGGQPKAAVLAVLAPRLTPALRERVFQNVIGANFQWFGREELPALLPLLIPEQVGRAWAAAARMKAPRLRAELWDLIWPYLPLEEREGAAQAIWQAALETPGAENRADTLLLVAAHQPPEHVAQTLAAAGQITSLDERALRLAELAAALPPGLPREQAFSAALEAIWQHGLPKVRARLLSLLAPHLSYPRLAETLERAGTGADELSALAPSLPANLLERAVQSAARVESENDRSQLLAALAPHLSASQFSPALAAARQIEDELARVYSLRTLAEGMEEAWLRRIVAAAGRLRSARAAARLLGGLETTLPPGLLAEALAAARAIRDPGYAGQALGRLAAALPEEQAQVVQSEALDRIAGLPTTGGYSLQALAPYLLPALTGRAMRMAEGLEEDLQTTVLAALAGQMNAELAARTLTIAAHLKSANRARLLEALGPRLTPDRRAEALQLALEIPEWHLQAAALAGLGPVLAGPARWMACRAALQAIEGNKRSQEQARVLVSLAPFLPADLLPQAAALAGSLKEIQQRTPPMAALGLRLGGEQGVALQAAGLSFLGPSFAFGPYVIGTLLRDAAVHLLDEMLPAAVEAARQLGWDGYRSLVVLAPRLPAGLLAKAWLPQNPPELLAALAPRWLELAQAVGRSELDLVSEVLRSGQANKRGEMLDTLAALAPVIRRLGGPQAQAETVQAILDVSEWWP